MIDILYEDDALIFINKPAGIVVQQRMHEPDEPFLHAEVLKHTQAFLMQRLDRGTSGVIFFSKRADLNARITRRFERKTIHKRYLALCEGELGEKQTIDAPIARAGAIKFAVREHGKRAITHVAPLQATRHGSLLAITLETGRTHQIRVHLAAIGHPLAGDWLYGVRGDMRPMLHAAEVEMTHPLTNEPLRVAAPLPQDFLEEAARRGLASWAEDRATSR
ncbi:MAG TPA: RluA family pseudouridine synthase [Thermoanaerobaculia bacterium]|nr:RluA family pseudouridine synthase [Thermoanaerobaculia bacterium]